MSPESHPLNGWEWINYLGAGFCADSVNLETLLRLKPDLILGVHCHRTIYDQLSQIAPTVLQEDSSHTWKEFLRASGDILGKSQETEEILTHYDQRIQKFKQQLGDRAAKTQVSIIFWSPRVMYLMFNESFSGTILKDLGLSRPQIRLGAA